MRVIGVDMERELELATLVHALEISHKLDYQSRDCTVPTFIRSDGESEVEEIGGIGEMCLHS